MHRLLKRQLKRFIGKESEVDALDPKIKEFLNTISEVYDSFDEQRRMQEHIITVSSEELRNSNAQLKDLLDKNSQLLKNKTIENKDIIHILHQYKDAIDQSLIVSRANEDGIITYANDKFCEISGYTREELIGSSHNIIRNYDNPEEMYTQLWETIKNKQVWHGTLSNRKKSGEIYYVKSTIVPLVNIDGNINEFIALRDDITKEVLYQEELKYQTQRLNTVFNSQEHISVIIKPDIGVVDVNDKFYETFGFNSLQDLENRLGCICKLFNEEKVLKNYETANRKWYKRFLDKNIEQINLTRVDERLGERIYKVSCKEIELQEEEHFLLTFVDITELENARKKAEIAKETKSIFLANMSHEIRTPLNAIIGFSDILKTQKLDSEKKNYANIISKSAESLLDIINDVLDLSKIESGKLEIEKEAFPINIFIDNIVELFSVKAKEKNIRFIFDSDPQMPYSVVSDSTRLRQVLSNLLSNAIKFTKEEGYVNFKLSLLEKTDSNVKIEFEIKDNGIGISKEHQESIFEPFNQADSGISRQYGGTGLGLSICKDIIDLLDSKIILESEEKKGSTFKFTLDLEVDKFIDDRDHHYNHSSFAITKIANDEEHLHSNILSYLASIGRVYEFNEDSVYNHIDILFCFDTQNLETIIDKFTAINKNAKVVYVGRDGDIKRLNIKNKITNHIDLPIYGSKIFNIISDNDDNVLNELEKKEIKKVKNKKSNKHFLVAEDNPNNQKLIEILLDQLGIKCTIANDGIEAIKLYEENKYDLVFMDINMPRLDGVGATKEILRKQKEEGLYKIPIIALTANSLEGDKEKYILEGMDDYISKPIVQNKLKDVINKYTNNIVTMPLKKEKKKKKIKLLFNKKNTIKKLGISENIVDMLINKFFETLEKDLEKLQEFIKTKSFEEIEKQAHYIKGSSLNLAMDDITNILVKIEEKAINKNCDEKDIKKIYKIAKQIRKSI